jgi:NADPH:quinone reductase-like Zn-dependent oxidoreductase
MSAHFRAVMFHRLGNPPEVLALEDVPFRPLGHDEVRIKVSAFALNRADWLFCRGEHYSLPRLPSRIGSECAGTVVDVGQRVNRSLVGRRICTVPFHNADYGVQGEYATVPQAYLAPWPDGVPATQAAALWMQYLTAYFPLIAIADVGPSDFVLVPAASSSAGLAAIQLARLRGARVIATSRTSCKAREVEAAGADIVMTLDDEEPIATRINRFTDERGVRIVFDPVAGPFLNDYVNALADNAVIFIYGLLSGDRTELDIVRLVRRAATIHPYSMFNHVRHPEQLEPAIAFVERAVLQGLRPIIDSVFALDDVMSAYERLDGHLQVGKIVVSNER